jgi:hypothetical protein
MKITTIDNNGNPWIICSPNDQFELDRFIQISASMASGELTHRDADQLEASKFSVARAAHVTQGGNHDLFFGIPA